MAVSDNKLNKFFSKHKVGELNSLKGKNSSKNKTPKKQLEHSIASNIEISQDEQPPSIITPSKNIKTSNLKSSVEHEVVSKKQNNDALLDKSQHTYHTLNTNDSLTNREQTVSESLADREQIVSESLADREQSVSKPLAKPLARSSTANTYSESTLQIFSDKEKELLNLIYTKCVNLCSTICDIYTSEIMQCLDIKANRVRNLFSRITKKGGIKVIANKAGKNALRTIEMSDRLYQQLNMVVPQSLPLAKPLADQPYSSSSINITTTTKNNIENFDEKKHSINLSGLEEYGFCDAHIKQLLNIKTDDGYLDSDVIQKSINYFAFDLRHNEKEKAIKKTPVDFFIGIMRNAKIYNPPKNYKSDIEMAQEIIFKQEQKEKARMEKIETEIMSLKRDKWINSLSDSDREKILKANRTTEYPMPDAPFLRSYYKKNIWPSDLKEYLSSAVDTAVNEN